MKVTFFLKKDGASKRMSSISSAAKAKRESYHHEGFKIERDSKPEGGR